jgi:hypothetical protein
VIPIRLPVHGSELQHLLISKQIAVELRLKRIDYPPVLSPDIAGALRRKAENNFIRGEHVDGI